MERLVLDMAGVTFWTRRSTGAGDRYLLGAQRLPGHHPLAQPSSAPDHHGRLGTDDIENLRRITAGPRNPKTEYQMGE